MKRYCIKIGENREIKAPITVQRFNDCCFEDIEILPIILPSNPVGISFELGYYDSSQIYQRISPIDATFPSSVKSFDLIIDYRGVNLESLQKITFDFNYRETCEEDYYVHTETIELDFKTDCDNTNNRTPNVTTLIKEDDEDGGSIYVICFEDVPLASKYDLRYCKFDGVEFSDCEFIEDIPADGNLCVDIPPGLLDTNERYEFTIFAINEDDKYIGESDKFIIRTSAFGCGGDSEVTLEYSVFPEQLEESDWTLNENFELLVQLQESNEEITEYKLRYRLKGQGDWVETDYVDDATFTNTGIEVFLTETDATYEFQLVAECDEDVCIKTIYGDIFEVDTPFVEGVSDDDDDDDGDDDDDDDFSDDSACCDVDHDSITFEMITTTSMRVLWDPVDDLDSYLVRWKAAFEDETAWQVEVVPGDRNYLDLEGLFPDTLYDFQIKVRCEIV